MSTDQAATKSRSIAIELFVLSAASLFAELLFVRWLSADVRAFSAFRTFPLVTCFIGLGVGFALGKDKLFGLAPVFLLISVCSIKAIEFLGVSLIPFPTVSVTTWNEISVVGPTFWLWVLFLAQILFAVLIGPFASMVAIGCKLGALFNELPALKAYCINIGGAIFGSVLFTVSSFTEISPIWQLGLLLAVLLYYIGFSDKKLFAVSAGTVAITMFIGMQVLPVSENSETVWTPYQRLDLVPLAYEKSMFGYNLLSNRIPYHMALDLTDSGIARAHSANQDFAFINDVLRRYETPFQLGTTKGNVLIVGAGMGNDVATGLRLKVGEIDAVELDPSILNLGKKRNPAAPYASPLVHAYCDDARHFFNTATSKYDLIVFSHLDSGYVVGQGSSSRVDNYVYTKESIARALSLLKPHGVLVLSYYSAKNWFNDRLLLTTREGAGYEPIEFTDTRDKHMANTYYVLGEAVRNKTFHLPPDVAKYAGPTPHDNAPVRVLTDDWPFLYVTPGIIDVPYLIVLLETLLIAAAIGSRFLAGKRQSGSGQMFFLGAAFLLLELQAISRLSRLYGSTWLTSALVINGILIMILLANLVVIKHADKLVQKKNLLYAGLGLSLVASYLLPVNDVLANIPGGEILVTALTVLPLLFAAMIFGSAFSKVQNASIALSFNLFGAVLGALLEYASNYVGINALVLIGLLLYALSWVFMPRNLAASASPTVQT